MRKTLKRGLATVLALVMCLGIIQISAFAAVSYAPPTSGMTADSDKYLGGATAAASTVMLSVLGIDVTSTNGAGVYAGGGTTESLGSDSSNLGIFGSDINDNPDPYFYNFFYNLSSTGVGEGEYDPSTMDGVWTATPYTLVWEANKNGMAGQASGTVTITVNGETKTTNPAFFYEPDILISLNGASGYAELLTEYQETYNPDYDPLIFSGSYSNNNARSDGLGLAYNQFEMCSGMVYLGGIVQNLMQDTGKTTRYDQSPYEIGVNYDKYDRGLYYYVQSKFDSGELTPVRYVIAPSYDSDTGYYFVSDSSVSGRNAQYSDGIGEDIYALLEAGYTFSDGVTPQPVEHTSSSGGGQGGGGRGGPGGGDGGTSTTVGYELTADELIEILNAPVSLNENATGVVVGADAGTADPTGDLADAGVRFLNNKPSCVYGMDMATVENGMGIPFFVGFFYYGQDESLNPINYLYYWMENFYHVSDNSAMETVVVNMLADADLPEGLAEKGAQVSDYSSSVIEDQILKGIEYYQNTLVPQYDAMVAAGEIESDSALYWSTLDTNVGIGSDVHNTNVNYTFTCTLVTDENGDPVLEPISDNVIYDIVFTSTNTTREGFVEEDGTWHYYGADGETVVSDIVLDETGEVYGTGQPTWWYIEDSKVKTDYTGLAENEYGWWYMEDGKCNFNFTGLVENDFGWWYIKDSHCTFDYTGTAENEYGWWYMENSHCNFNYTGTVENEFGWWYMEDSHCTFSYTGTVQNEYGWWYMENSHCTFNYTGPVENEFGWWYMENSRCNFNFNGTVDGHTFVNSHEV